MELTTEDGTVLRGTSSSELRTVLAKLGLPGNGYAILAAAPEHYIQVAGNDAEGYIAEYREGSEESHHSSKMTNLSREQIVELMTAYLSGGSWKTMISWEAGFGSKPVPGKLEGKPGAMLVLLSVIALTFLVQGVRETIATRQFLQRAVEVPGRVVQIVPNANTSDRMIEYKDLQGNLQRMRAALREEAAAVHREGEYVTVIYDPADAAPASTAKIATFSGTWASALVMLLIGTVGCAVVGFHWWVASRSRS